MPSMKLFAFIGILFGALASPMAYIIFYREYIHRFEHVRARSLALRGAIVVFLFFLAFAIASGFTIAVFIVPHSAGASVDPNAERTPARPSTRTAAILSFCRSGSMRFPHISNERPNSVFRR